MHAGDLIVWNARAIHKIDGPSSKDWGSRKRRVLGGTGVKTGACYWGENRALFSDMSTHDLKDGDPLVRVDARKLKQNALESTSRSYLDCAHDRE